MQCQARVLRLREVPEGAALRRLRRLQELDLCGNRYGIGVSWDTLGERNVDIDLQAVVVDTDGVIIDCAYYNNLKAGRWITHSGDETSGRAHGIREMVWVALRKLQANVGLLLFVVAAYSGGQLKDVANGRLRIFEESESREIAMFEMERSAASVKLAAAMFRSPAGHGGASAWKLRVIDEPAQRGQHFMDILPFLAEAVRIFIPHAPKKQKVAFAMEKGGVLDLPQDLSRITVGLGWDVDEGECDLDVSAVLLDRDGVDLEAVFFGRLESEQHGIKHSGDNLTGEGEGDDEQVVVRLDAIGPQVRQVFFVVNIYSAHRNFQQVAEPYCRVVDDATGAELCRYMLRDAGSENGLIMSKIAREAGDRWGFHALGLPCRGRTYKDSLPHIRHSCKLKTASLLLRSNNVSEPGTPTGTPIGAWSASSRSQVYVMPPPAESRSSCCVVQ